MNSSQVREELIIFPLFLPKGNANLISMLNPHLDLKTVVKFGELQDLFWTLLKCC